MLNDIRERLTTVQREMLNFVYEYWKHHNYEWLRREEVAEHFQVHHNFIAEWNSIGEAFVRKPDSYILTIFGIALVDGSEESITLFVEGLRYFYERFVQSQSIITIDPSEITADLGWSDEKYELFQHLLYTTPHYLYEPSGRGMSIDASILRYSAVKTIEDFYHIESGNPYLQGLYVINSRVDRNFIIDLKPPKTGGFKHLILTGKNGSGKSSVLKAINKEIKNLIRYDLIGLPPKETPFPDIYNERYTEEVEQFFFFKALSSRHEIDLQKHSRTDLSEFEEKNDRMVPSKLPKVGLIFFNPIRRVSERFRLCHILYSFLRPHRPIRLNEVQGPQKIGDEKALFYAKYAHDKFLQFIINQYSDQAVAYMEKNTAKAEAIKQWFDDLLQIFRKIFDESKLQFNYLSDRYNFEFKLPDGRTFDLNELADGYAQILRIVDEILMRRELYKKLHPGAPEPPGIVVIDEIETHLHVELQKRVLPFLTTLFPTIQFIVSTHSPFVLSSLDNAVIYDLEKKLRVEDLSGYSYPGIVEGFFNVDNYSAKIKEKLARFEQLLTQESPDLEARAELQALKDYLTRIPPDLAPELCARVNQLLLDHNGPGAAAE